MKLCSILHDSQYRDLPEEDRLERAEEIIEHVEGILRDNARGNISAADVCAELWGIGLDPNETEA